MATDCSNRSCDSLSVAYIYTDGTRLFCGRIRLGHETNEFYQQYVTVSHHAISFTHMLLHCKLLPQLFAHIGSSLV